MGEKRPWALSSWLLAKVKTKITGKTLPRITRINADFMDFGVVFPAAFA